MDLRRIGYIDTAKGIGILLVVWSHMNSTAILMEFMNWGGYITTFYMPLFFIMSGLFFRLNNLRKRVKSLLIPYAGFYVLAFAVYVLKSLFKHEATDWGNFLVPLIGGTNNYQNTPLWFLLSLTEIMLAGYFVIKHTKKKYAVAVTLVLSCLAIYSKEILPHIPYYIDVSILCLPFFTLGYYYRDYVLNKIDWKTSLTFLSLSILAYVVSPSRTNVSQNYVPQGFSLFFIVACSASLGVIGLSKYVRGLVAKILQFWGRNSLCIMCVHIMLMVIDGICMSFIPNVLFANVISLLTIMVLSSIISVMINRHLSFILGR